MRVDLFAERQQNQCGALQKTSSLLLIPRQKSTRRLVKSEDTKSKIDELLIEFRQSWEVRLTLEQ